MGESSDLVELRSLPVKSTDGEVHPTGEHTTRMLNPSLQAASLSLKVLIYFVH